MKKFALGLLLAGAALCGSQHAQAAQQVMCSPESVVGTQGRTVGQSIGGGSQSAVPSGSLYQLNGQGCTLVKVQDIGYFLSQGYSQGSQQGAIVFNTGVATGTTNYVAGTLPAGAYIQKIIWNNLTANAAGNLALGSTAAGVDIVAAVACAANCLAEPTIAKDLFSATAPTTLNLSSSAWNSANVNLTVIFSYF